MKHLFQKLTRWKTIETFSFSIHGGFVIHSATIEDRINGAYTGLSGKLQVAAKYVADNPVDIATRSLRAVAASSGVSPATFSRLARVLGYADYEQMREEGREAVERKISPFSERAHVLLETTSGQGASTVLQRQAMACRSNIEELQSAIDPDRLSAAVDKLHAARTVLLVGAMGSAGIIDYFGYMAHWFKANWKTVGRNGTELSPALSRLGSDDVVFALAKSPYARRTVAALKVAHEAGATTIVITDSRTSPALQFSDFGFVTPTESPQFFSSYAATLVLMEAIISLLLARVGPEAEAMIRSAEIQIDGLGENWTS
ncbi:MurR/RpiR family transcriptional regulator [Tateyamaria sp.]|uniref:MurR/RpiR family transcriptional regulator n=1 Tax=Tateyamaria sp. TaxID=1929288 RepID=UPI003B21040C